MRYNVGAENPSAIAWDGTAAKERPITGFLSYSIVVEVTDAITADAVFNLQMAKPSEANPCVAGVFADVPQPEVCGEVPADADRTLITIPAGTPVGSLCSFTPHCSPASFVKLVAVSGDTAKTTATISYGRPTK